MNIMNGLRKFKELDAQILHNLNNWALDTHEKFSKIGNGDIKSLFQGDGKLITPLIWANWLIYSFVYYGIVLYLPYALDIIDGGMK
jgi:hypothetical protein